jgi:ABC-type sulfate transport system permease component
VSIPRSLPAFATPLFSAAILTLLATILGLEAYAAKQEYPWNRIREPALQWIITVPATMLGITLAAWFKGQLGTWWAYEERYAAVAPRDGLS